MGGVSDNERMGTAINTMRRELQQKGDGRHGSRQALETLSALSKDGDPRLWSDHFGAVLHLVLGVLGDLDANVRSVPVLSFISVF